MSPQMRRYLPFILVALLIFVLLPLLRRGSSSSITDGDRSTLTLKALQAIDGGEVAYFKANQHYTSHLSDLIGTAKPVADWLTLGMAVQLDSSSDGKSYVVQLESSVLNVVRSRTGAALTTDSCTVIKSSSGVTCPSGTTRAAKPVTPKTTATGTTPTPTAPISTTNK